MQSYSKYIKSQNKIAIPCLKLPKFEIIPLFSPPTFDFPILFHNFVDVIFSLKLATKMDKLFAYMLPEVEFIDVVVERGFADSIEFVGKDDEVEF